ncbi:unnamed protein product [Gordionus sp. m RMFG-2023]
MKYHSLKLDPCALYAAEDGALLEIYKIIEYIDKLLNIDVSNSVTHCQYDLKLMSNSIIDVKNDLNHMVDESSSLFNDLKKEEEYFAIMDGALKNEIDINTLESYIDTTKQNTQEEMFNEEKKLKELKNEKYKLIGKIGRKKDEHLKNKTRLESMNAMIPSHADELEALEKRIKYLNKLYITKHRNLSFLTSKMTHNNSHDAKF